MPLEKSLWPATPSSGVRDITVGDLLREAATAEPDRLALVDGTPDPADRREWTYRRLLADVEGAAEGVARPLRTRRQDRDLGTQQCRVGDPPAGDRDGRDGGGRRESRLPCPRTRVHPAPVPRCRALLPGELSRRGPHGRSRRRCGRRCPPSARSSRPANGERSPRPVTRQRSSLPSHPPPRCRFSTRPGPPGSPKVLCCITRASSTKPPSCSRGQEWWTVWSASTRCRCITSEAVP